MEKYLVTGGNGQLGMAMRRLMPYELVSYIKTREALDIASARISLARITSLGPDAVINCAAYTNVRQSEVLQDEAWKTNAWAVQQLAYGLASANIPLIHVSTDFVFGMDRGRREPYVESSCTGPTSYYGWTKLVGEHAIWQAAERFPDWPFFIVRTAGVFERHWRQPKNFPGVIATRLARRQPAKVVSDVYTNITYAPDLAKCLWFLAENRFDVPRGCYHITNEGVASWFEIAQELRGWMPDVSTEVHPISSEEYERSQGCDPKKVAKFTGLSIKKFQQLPGAPKLRPWRKVIKEYGQKWKD